MSRILTGIVAGIAVIAVGLAASLYIELQAKVHTIPTQPAGHSEPFQAALRGDYAHMTPQEQQVFDARQIAARQTINEAHDLFLTGDQHGSAEWKAPDDDQYPTICGVTPNGRYVIARNEIGRTRHDEPNDGPTEEFNRSWTQAGCEKTSPLQQRRLLAQKHREEFYNLTHPYNPDCVMAQLSATATGNKAAMKLSDDPHYCQDGSFERGR